MLKCQVIGSKAEVTLSGKDFMEDLDRLKDAIEMEDRIFDPQRNVWTISNLQRYEHVNFIANALKTARLQIPLF